MPGHRLGMTLRLSGLGVAQRGLGDERPQAGLLALLLEETLLFDRDGELGAHPLEALGDVEETPLQDRPGHPGQSTGWRRSVHCPTAGSRPAGLLATRQPPPPWAWRAGRRRGTRRGSTPSRPWRPAW